ncbi:MAG: hemolysin family protein [Chloroflexota bacterium]|nr:hemolysin family protein [Chloroflexota bacterium]
MIDPLTWAKLLAFGLGILFATLGATAEAAFDEVSRPRLRLLLDGGVKRAQRVLDVLENGTSLYTTIFLLNTVGIAAAVAGIVLLALGPAAPDAPWVPPAMAAACALVLLIAQAVGRGIGLARPEHTTLALIGPLRLLARVLLPLGGPLHLIELQLATALGTGRPSEPNGDDELRLLVETVDEAHPLEADERDMIHGIFELSERPAREVMVPRVDMAAEPRDAPIRQVLDRVIQTGYSRIPIYDETIDNVIGVVYAKDMLRHLRDGKLGDPVEPIARKPYFVPDTKKVDELLQELQQSRVHVAIVVDEYGGTAGLVTIEDILEEIVGEIRDEYDVHEEQLIEHIDETVSVVDARVSIRDVNEELDLHLDPDEFDTLGGLVYHELGGVPSEGDEVRVNGCLVTVLSTEGRRIKKLRVALVGSEA